MRVYDIDMALLEQRPMVRLRGEVYPVADKPVADRLRMARDKQNLMAEYRARAKDDPFDEQALRAMRTLQADAAQELLEGLPREVAESLSEREWLALNQSVLDALGVEPRVEAKNEPAAPGKAKPKTGGVKPVSG